MLKVDAQSSYSCAVQLSLRHLGPVRVKDSLDGARLVIGIHTSEKSLLSRQHHKLRHRNSGLKLLSTFLIQNLVNCAVLHATAKKLKVCLVFIGFYSEGYWRLKVYKFLVVSPKWDVGSGMSSLRQKP